MNHVSRSRSGIVAVARRWSGLLLLSTAVLAGPVLDSLPTLDTVSSRLSLNPQQEAQLRPMFENRIAELHQTRLQLEQASTPQQQREVLRQAKAAGDAFNAQVESVLTPTQRNEWREIRAELREKADERIEDKSSG